MGSSENLVELLGNSTAAEVVDSFSRMFTLGFYCLTIKKWAIFAFMASLRSVGATTILDQSTTSVHLLRDLAFGKNGHKNCYKDARKI
jgi:hypothetical protein